MFPSRKIKPKDMKVSLSKAEKRAIKEKERQRIKKSEQRQRAINRKNKAQTKKLKKLSSPQTCQNTIDYKYIFQSGICQSGDNFYSKTLKFSDINYDLLQQKEQEEIFSKYCEILDYFEPGVKIQITLHNRKINADEFKRNMFLKPMGDDKDSLRQEYNEMLSLNALNNKNSIIKERFITFGIESENYETAYNSLMSIENDLISRFNSIGSEIMSLSGEERLEHLNSILNPGEPLHFDYDLLTGTSLTTKDFIAPYFFDFKPDNKQIYFEFGDYYGQVLIIRKYPSGITDTLLKELSEIPCNSLINIHTYSLDNAYANEMIKTKLAFMEQDKANRQQKLIQQCADPDMIPQHLKRFMECANSLVNSMDNDDQRIYKGALMVFAFAETLEELNENTEKMKGVARARGCELMPLACEQEAGLNASLPLARNKIKISRTLTTVSQAIFIPFSIQEIFETSGMYYGINLLSRNLIFFNRKGLKNPSGFVLGTPGSGKSFATKREIVNILLSTSDDEILIIDPESEYLSLAKNFDGEIIKISNDTSTYFNPLDINITDYAENNIDNSLLAFKTEFIFSFLDVIVTKESGIGLSGAERTLVDMVLTETYKKYFSSKNSTMPTLVDFFNELQAVNAPELRAEKNNLLKVLGLYVTGSFNLFAHNTNVDITNRIVVYDIKELGEQLKTLGMLVILDQVWHRVTENRISGRKTWIIIDEAHLLFSNEFSANFLNSLWKRVRKYGGVCTGITQNVTDLLENPLASKMLSNSDYIMMLNQSTTDRVKLSELLHISQRQQNYITNAGAGQGLIFAGNTIIPFMDNFPKDTKIYSMLTTKLDEVIKKENG